MSRLKKIAYRSRELYHTTSSQLFLNIIEEGSLSPNSYTDQQTRPRTNYKSLNLSRDGKEMSVFDITKSQSQLSNSLKKKIEELTNDAKDELGSNYTNRELNDQLRNIFLKVKESSSNPSSEIAVYLTNVEHNEYYINKVSGTVVYDNLPTFPVELKVKVFEDALGPDLYEEYYNGDTSIDRNSDKPLWEQSLEANQECIHYGPISNDEITSVYFHIDFFKSHPVFGDKSYENFKSIYNDFDSILDSTVAGDSWISYSEAIKQLQALYDYLKNYDTNEELTQRHPDEGKIRRYENEENQNFYGSDVIYKNLSQEEMNYLNDHGLLVSLNTFMFNDSDIYYGFGGTATPVDVLSQIKPDIVLINENESSVFSNRVETVNEYKSSIDQNATGNYKIYIDQNDDWISTLDYASYGQVFNSFDEMNQQKVGKRLVRKVYS